MKWREADRLGIVRRRAGSQKQLHYQRMTASRRGVERRGPILQPRLIRVGCLQEAFDPLFVAVGRSTDERRPGGHGGAGSEKLRFSTMHLDTVR